VTDWQVPTKVVLDVTIICVIYVEELDYLIAASENGLICELKLIFTF